MSANKKYRVKAMDIALEASKLSKEAQNLSAELAMSAPSTKFLKEEMKGILAKSKNLSEETKSLHLMMHNGKLLG